MNAITDSGALPLLNGEDLAESQADLVSALLRRPALARLVQNVGLRARHLAPELHELFHLATLLQRSEIVGLVEMKDPMVLPLWQRGIEWDDKQAGVFARQIIANVERAEQFNVGATLNLRLTNAEISSKGNALGHLGRAERAETVKELSMRPLTPRRAAST
jgi:hypothetical protein